MSRDRPAAPLAAAVVAYLAVHLMRSTPAVLDPGMLGDLHSPAAAAARNSFLAGYLLSQLPGAVAARRFGVTNVLAASTFACAAVVMVTPSAAMHGLLPAARFALGVAAGPFLPALIAWLIDDPEPLRRNRRICLALAVSPLSALLQPALAVVGWRETLALEVTLAAAGAALLLRHRHTGAEERDGQAERRGPSLAPTVAILGSNYAVVMIGLSLLGAAAKGGGVGWLAYAGGCLAVLAGIILSGRPTRSFALAPPLALASACAGLLPAAAAPAAILVAGFALHLWLFAFWMKASDALRWHDRYVAVPLCTICGHATAFIAPSLPAIVARIEGSAWSMVAAAILSALLLGQLLRISASKLRNTPS